MRSTWICLALLGALACSGDGTTEPTDPGPRGVYRLESFDGLAPPTIVDRRGSDSLQVMAGQITMTAPDKSGSGSFSSAHDYRFWVGGQVGQERYNVSGIYRVRDRNVDVIIRQPAPDSVRYEWGDATLTLRADGHTVIYRLAP